MAFGRKEHRPTMRKTVGNLSLFLQTVKGYSDPPGFDDRGQRFDELNLAGTLPPLVRSNSALMKMRLPDGRFVPVHDTWATDKREALKETTPYLLPAVGHACLGGGQGAEQTQFHLTWSGGFGHQHADNLSLLAFAYGRELLSDLGYTHTRHRVWSATTAAHNTVVIDGRNQSAHAGSGGALRWFDVSEPRLQAVSADGERGYPGLARVYRRALMTARSGLQRRYVVDVFEVEGGEVHDYFLHGDADFPGSAASNAPLEPQVTLLPAGFDWKAAENEDQYTLATQPYWAYGYLRNLRSAKVPAGSPVEVVFRGGSSGPGVKVTLLPEPSSTLVLGEDPAVRGAREDDGKLDDFTRPFLMLRHEPADGRSIFVAVLEPFNDQPAISLVERIAGDPGTVTLRITADGQTEVITYTPDAPPGLERQERLALQGVEGGALVVSGAAISVPAPGDVVHVQTEDGWVYPYTVSWTETTEAGARIYVEENPGFEFDNATQRLHFLTFPQREHRGPATLAWLLRARNAPGVAEDRRIADQHRQRRTAQPRNTAK